MIPGAHRKRCKRYDEPWHAHYLTFSCYLRQPFFRGKLTPGWFLEAIDRARVSEPFDLWAFVIMPEHVHLLLLPHEGSRISHILRAVKKPMADRAIAWVRANAPEFLPRMRHMDGERVAHRFWQAGGGYDRNLWSVRPIHQGIRYVHENPVRRGLVSRPGDWPWSSFRAWETGVDEPIRIDRDSVPILVH